MKLSNQKIIKRVISLNCEFTYLILGSVLYIENFDIYYQNIWIMVNKKFWYESDTGKLGFLEFLEKVRKESDNK